MKHKFEWNEFADQPHNVAPRSERMRHHVRCWRTYFSMVWADLRDGLPALFLYRRYRKGMFRRPVEFEGNMFAVSASPRPGRNEEVVALLKEAGVRQTLVRIPSWEKDRLASYEDFVRLLSSSGIGLTIAFLQRREEVFDYANAHRGKVKKALIPSTLRMAEEEPKRISSKSWAAMIRKVYEVDPMVCPKCGGRMKVIAFITEFGAVDRIIAHLKLTFVAAKPPPSHVLEQVTLAAAEESRDYF